MNLAKLKLNIQLKMQLISFLEQHHDKILTFYPEQEMFYMWSWYDFYKLKKYWPIIEKRLWSYYKIK